MNRNVESHFSELPSVDIQRSIFDRSSEHKTSFNVGDLIPFYWDEVLPGDTFQVTTSCVVRLQTLLTPVMDNMYMDTYFFFVPARLTWTHWKEFMGENTESAWVPQTKYSVPYIRYPAGGFATGTIADYMGIPVGVKPTDEASVDMPQALPIRAYALICDQWFRDQNLSDPLNINLGDSAVTGSNGSTYVTDVAKGGMPFKAAKYHDYFTSALPSPQKGPAVSVFDILAPVGTYKDMHEPIYKTLNGDTAKLRMQGALHGQHVPDTDDYYNFYIRASQSADYPDISLGQYNYQTDVLAIPSNLWADLGSGISINELRLAFQLQKYYEKNARAGTRYREVLLEHFGVRSPDARMMIPEYLGGHRFPLSIHQVANTSQGENSFLGDLGAMSNTSDVHEDFIQSFTEHGFVIGVCVVRYDHSYPQGLERAWSRRTNLDYYWPVFANIGEQPIKVREIYLEQTPPAQDEDQYYNNDVFGYQEAWADYRYKPNRVSGEMRPGIQNSLASWHLADDYSFAPYLSDSWIREDKTNVDRVLAVTSEVSNQVFADFYVKNIATRPMPMYSIPGLIDHH